MTQSRLTCLLLVGVSLVAVGGCAAFRSGETQPPASWPISKGPGKQSISLLVTGEGIVNNKRQDAPQQAIQIWQEAAVKSYKDSGLFSEVKIGAAATDLRSEIHIVDRGEASMGLAMLSGFTLTLFPANGQEDFILNTTLKNQEGKELGTFEKKETMSFWIQFFLIFIMPFNWPNTVVSEMLYDLNRATISQAHSAGLFQAWQMTEPVHLAGEARPLH